MNSLTAWLTSFNDACQRADGESAARLFADDGLWRDYLAFNLDLQTVEGRNAIGDYASLHAIDSDFNLIGIDDSGSETEGSFSFSCRLGEGRGYCRLKDGLCSTLFTSLNSLPPTRDNSISRQKSESDPFVLIIGGGQSGLALGAQLSRMEIPYLIVDKYPHVGDQWRSRYDSLVLHDPVWYDHLPFKPFPDSWPVFTPKEKMGDWLEQYAEELSLDIRTDTRLIHAQYDEVAGGWHAQLEKGGSISEVRATHLVMALGLSGFAHTPEFVGQDDFVGPQLHSSQFNLSESYAGKQVIVVGANNSAHDIASALVSVDAKPVMLQRSSTLVVRQSVYCKTLLGKLYSQEAVNRGITADEADFLFTSVPMRLLEERHRLLWSEIQQDEAEYYQRITDAGFNLDFAEDGTGLGLKYRRTASGYYIDVGASEMVVNGQIAIRSGVGIQRLTERQVILDSGESLEADAIVYATGYGNMVDWVAKLIDEQTADRIGPCWGYGSNTKGDPGPWLGELRNMWKPTAQPGLWFMGGNLAQARYFSRVLALQLQARFIGMVEP